MQKVTIKKYSNRRLYDTDQSKYITQDELAERIRDGIDVRVIDARSGDDLTRATLTQIIMESRGAARLLPSSLLMQLIRMDDEALAEFLGRYLAGALELYQVAKKGAGRVAPYYPFAEVPFAATNAFARLFTGAMDLGGRAMDRVTGARPDDGAAHDDGPHAAPEAAPETRKNADEIAALRDELAELKELIRART